MPQRYNPHTQSSNMIILLFPLIVNRIGSGSVDAAPVFAVRARTERFGSVDAAPVFAFSLVYTRSVVRTYTLVARLSDLCKEDTDYLFAAGQKCPHARQSEWNERTPRIGSSVTLAAAPLTGCYTRLVYFDFWLFNLLTASACFSQNYFTQTELVGELLKQLLFRSVYYFNSSLASLCRAFSFAKCEKG